MISNSFHSSAKSHSLSSAGSLSKAERHNDRGYLSFCYDQSKIAQIVGDSSTLAADVERAINEQFNKYVEEYNERQRRKDRKISGTAFEYFCSQKKLDIATEAIFQVADQEFWGEWRKDTVIQRGKKQYVLHEFPDDVKSVMNEILGRQVQAYENIYKTHGAEIAARIKAAYDGAFEVAQKIEEARPEFREIYKIPSKERTNVLKQMSQKDQVQYSEYAKARDTMALIIKLNLQERAENDQLHIKVVTATGHYDEWSPHIHAVGLCWADGYKNGLSSRVAKSVVLNKWALEVIQERLNEIAQEEIAKHPEIFGNEKIKPKEQGRNFDYTTEQIRRQNLAKLDERIAASKASERIAMTHELKAIERAYEAERKAVEAASERQSVELELLAAKQELINTRDKQRIENYNLEQTIQTLSELEERVELIQDYEEYTQKADEIEERTSRLNRFLEVIQNATRIFKEKEAREFIDFCKNEIADFFVWVKKAFGLVKEFEKAADLPEEKCRSSEIDKRIEQAAAKVKDTPWRDDGERHL